MICTKCHIDKLETDFYKRNKSDKLEGQCKKCRLVYRSKYQKLKNQKNPSHYKNIKLKSLYGITLKEYEKLRVNQGCRCAICGTHESELSKKLNVDHCHATGKVRGLLCNPCNQAIGAFKETEM